MNKPAPTYPRTVYVLTRNFIVRKVTLVRPYSRFSIGDGYTKGGAFYNSHEIHESAKAAIKAARSQLKRRKKALESSLALTVNHIAALDKAEADTGADSPKGDA